MLESIKKLGHNLLCLKLVSKAAVVLSAATIMASSLLPALPAAASPTITEYGGLPYNGQPGEIISGTDGLLYFTQGPNPGTIGYIGPSSSFAAAKSFGSSGAVQSITPGPDGNMWYTVQATAKIGETPFSYMGNPTEYSLSANTYPIEIATGPDGALWFSYYTVNSSHMVSGSGIGRISTTGAATYYSVSVPNTFIAGGIVAGPDGAVWFIDQGARSYGRITTNGTITEFPYPSSSSEYGGQKLVNGPDGAVWASSSNSITRISTNGSMRVYSIPDFVAGNGSLESVGVQGITIGSDNALWFTEEFANKIGRITPTGTIAEYSVPSANSAPLGISAGPDGAVWFTEFSGDKIGRIAVPTASPTNLSTVSPTKTPVLSWESVSGATSYNIYRNGTNIGSSTTTSYTDNSAPEGTNSYYVTAVGPSGESDTSNSISVLVDLTAPTISYSLSPSPNGRGWSNSDVTVSFTCNDGLSGIASCSLPVTVSAEGANQSVTGTATDNAGNTTTITPTVNLDKTAPVISNVTLATDPLPTAQTTTLSANVTDALSGVNRVEYYSGADPGQGNGISMNVNNGVASATVGPYFTAGMYTFYVRSQDNAGNWSQATPVTLDVFNPSGGYAAGHGFVTPNGPTSNPGDYLPAVSGSNVKATFDFTVKYDTSTSTVPSGQSTFTWGSGNCKKANNSCFVVALDTTTDPNALSWLVVPGDNTAVFQGIATLSLNGQTMGSNYITRVSVVGTTTTSPGHYELQVFQSGANPDIDTPIYQASGDLVGGATILHQ